MYAYIKGTIGEIGEDRCVVEASGVGYELFCSAKTLKCLKVGAEHRLYTHFNVAMSQDVMALYGFETTGERAMFRRLISVTRVGPKLALSVLSKLEPEDIALAVLTENAAAFEGVTGMGKKTAARVMLELKEKIDAGEMVARGNGEAEATGARAVDMRAEATAALVSLGYDGVTAGRTIAAVPDCERVEDMITEALRSIARKGTGNNG